MRLVRCLLLAVALACCVGLGTSCAEDAPVLFVEESPEQPQIIVEPPLLHTVDFYTYAGELFISFTVEHGTILQAPLDVPYEANAQFSHWYDPVYGTEAFVFDTPVYGSFVLWPYYVYTEIPYDADAPVLMSAQETEYKPTDSLADYVPVETITFHPENILKEQASESVIATGINGTEHDGLVAWDAEAVAFNLIETTMQAPPPSIEPEAAPAPYADTGILLAEEKDRSAIQPLDSTSQSRIGIMIPEGEVEPRIVVMPLAAVEILDAPAPDEITETNDDGQGITAAEKEPVLVEDVPQDSTSLTVKPEAQPKIGIEAGTDGSEPRIIILADQEQRSPADDDHLIVMPQDTPGQTDTDHAEDAAYTPAAQSTLFITADAQTTVSYGDVISLTGDCGGMDIAPDALCWQYAKDGEWVDTGATGLTYSFVLDADNYYWAWRLVAK